jgi:hypothetical protein
MPLLSLIVTDNDGASFAILLPFGASDAFQFHGLRHGHRGPLYHQHVAFGGKRNCSTLAFDGKSTLWNDERANRRT